MQIDRYTKVGGCEGTENGNKIGRDLIATLFTPHLMTTYSWTGISRTAGVEKKQPFQGFCGILDLFYNIIRKADFRWTESMNAKLFKDKVLKHSKKIEEIYEKKRKKNGGSSDTEESLAAISNTEAVNEQKPVIIHTMKD